MLPIDSSQAIYEVTKAQGNLKLAAERLRIDEGTLIAILASDPVASNSLYQQSRITAAIQILSTLNLVKETLIASLPDIAPYDVSKTFVALIQALNTLTNNSVEQPAAGANGDLQSMYRILPPHVRKALQEVAEASNDQ